MVVVVAIADVRVSDSGGGDPFVCDVEDGVLGRVSQRAGDLYRYFVKFENKSISMIPKDTNLLEQRRQRG